MEEENPNPNIDYTKWLLVPYWFRIRCPRPTDNCNDCQGSLVLCREYGRGPYWRHVATKGTCTGHQDHAETLTHKLAKNMIVEYLNDEGVVQCWRKCQQCCNCDCAELSKSTYEAHTFVLEHAMVGPNKEREVLDVAGLDRDGKVVCGIEIRKSKYTHTTTTSLLLRSSIPCSGLCRCLKSTQFLSLVRI